MVTSLSGCMGDITIPLDGYTSSNFNLVDWLFVYPIGYLMNFIGGVFNDSLGIAIIITTIIVRFGLFPIYAGNSDMQIKQMAAKEDFDKLAIKYANRKDPESQQAMFKERMEINKKHGISYKSCLALPIQMLLLISMTEVLYRIKIPGGNLSLENTDFFGFDISGSLWDGATSDRVFCGFLVFLVVITMAFNLWQSQKRMKQSQGDKPMDPMAESINKTMKYFLIAQPFMMGMYAANNTSMALYWVVGTICSIVIMLISDKRKQKALKKFEDKKDVIEIL